MVRGIPLKPFLSTFERVANLKIDSANEEGILLLVVLATGGYDIYRVAPAVAVVEMMW